MPNICAPNTIYDKTCLNLKAIKRLISQVNKNEHFGNHKIKIAGKTREQLIVEVRAKLSCHSEIDTCILKNTNFFKNIVKNFYKPITPGKHDWLSTIDINDVMSQYEKKYKNFIFMGAVPIDFNEFYDEIANMNLKKLSKLKKKIGFVFNTDPSYKEGEHWISLFLDLEDNTLCFFDSANSPAPKQIQKLIKRLVYQAKKMNINLTVISNNVTHQLGSNACGVYSLYFLISRLEGKSCNDIFNKKIHDKEMNKYRNVFFRKPVENHV